ncbi:hypothetical protein BBBOND_0107630 [Babesia bigemina]|uniref:Uncharacterized protein n=1 Tax=Babesia bigemina TaxID=5866 RepID=A0A061D9Q7_BABBI|nr:hypothetical protein BBBOND_0107630 [Babesia bigemina]CDR94465.1 hypothetical protein BBBOND_0107630 [Babesia bigemina]|eukprot:XP_012766651.1 hypothetical protein BBBOND_0107630 [Babesia bigemina]
MVAISFLFNGNAAPLNVNRPDKALNEDIMIYINGQRMTYEALKKADPRQDIIYLISHEHMKKHINYLKDLISHYDGVHAFIPYLKNIIKYCQRKLDGAKEKPYVTFNRAEFRTEYPAIFRGIDRTPLQPISPAYYRQVLLALHRFSDAPLQTQGFLMHTWMFLCQRVYEASITEMRTLGVANTAIRSPEKRNDTTPANTVVNGDTSSRNGTTVSGDNTPNAYELLYSTSAGNTSTSPYVIGSLGAWEPAPDPPLDNSNGSVETAGRSNDNAHGHQNASENEWDAECDDDDSFSNLCTQPEEPEEDDADWDAYFKSFLQRLKKIPRGNLRSGAPST